MQVFWSSPSLLFPDQILQALFDEVHIRLGRRSPLLRFLLESVKQSGDTPRRGTSRSWITTEDDAMSIKREDLDAGRVDLADVTTGKRLPLIHPGAILRDDFLVPMKISIYTLAQAIKVPRSRVNDIVLGRRGITADTAFRLARYFGTTADFWINLQARYDLDSADRKIRRRIEREVRPRAA